MSLPPPPPPPKRGIVASLRNSFLTGLIIVAPAVLTIWLVFAAVEFIDNRVLPLIPRQILPGFLTGFSFPGMGVLIFLAFTLLVGWFAKNFIGRQLIELGERIVDRMPVVRSVYQGLKQIAETVFSQTSSSFSRACLVEYPRRGLWAVAFVSTETRGEVRTRIDARAADADGGGTPTPHVAVFLPTTPNPTSGFLLFVPESDIIPLDMSVEDAAKLVISAGLVVPDPDRLNARVARRR